MGSSARQPALAEAAQCLKITEAEVLKLAQSGQLHTTMNGSTKVFHLDYDPKRDPKYLPTPLPQPSASTDD